MKKFFTSLLFCFVLGARAVVLEWDANTESDLAGYRAYYGPRSREYSTVVDVRNFTSVVLPTLPGTTFYAVTAYNAEGVESEYSDEVAYTAPDSARSFVWRLPSGSILLEHTFSLFEPIVWLPLEIVAGPRDYTITVDTGVPEEYFRFTLQP